MILLSYDGIPERAKAIGRYVIEHNATVRQVAKEFDISKTTCHKDISEVLPKYDPDLAKKAREVLMQNKAERHIRGGQSMKRKYEERRLRKE